MGDGDAATGKTVTVAFSVKVEVIWRLFARPAAGQQRAGVKNRKSIKAGACREKEACITHEIMTVMDLWRYTKDEGEGYSTDISWKRVNASESPLLQQICQPRTEPLYSNIRSWSPGIWAPRPHSRDPHALKKPIVPCT